MDFKDYLNMECLQRIHYLMDIGLLVSQRVCQKCNQKMVLRKRAKLKDIYSWRCKKCKNFLSIRRDSFFDLFQLPILLILEIIDYWAKERKIVDMEDSLKVSRPTLVRVNRFLRQLCLLDLNKENFKVGGPNQIVEIDESVFNKVKYNKGKDLVHYHKDKQLWVFGIRERSSKKCLFQAVNNRQARTLIPIIQQHILPKSVIYSDQWRSYFAIKDLKENYEHFMVNHSKEFIDRRTGCHTNGIESIWNKCKAKIRSANGINRRYVQEYLDEVMWRHNECLVQKSDDKKKIKYTRRNAFRKMINLLHVRNIEIFKSKINELDREEALVIQKEKSKINRKKFLSEEFIIQKSRIKNFTELTNDTTTMVSRCTQTDSSVFDYAIKAKLKESIDTFEKFVDPNVEKVDLSTQTDFSVFIETLKSKKKAKKNTLEPCTYNLRKRK